MVFDKQKDNILFVCTGNTCRSPMAEAIFNDLIEKKDNSAWFAKSAGLAAEKGAPATEHAVEVMSDYGIELGDHRALQLSRVGVQEAKLVLTMNETQRDLLHLYFPGMKDKIFSFMEYIGESGDVPDPFGGDLNFYKKTGELLMRSIPELIERLPEQSDKTDV